MLGSDRESKGWKDGGAGVKAFLRRVFGDGENPLTWAIPLYSLWGIAVRIHILFVIYAIAQVIRSVVPSETGAAFVLPLLAAIFVLVLIHEYGHCIACRRVGGEADEIILWPLGGLAMVSPPHDWKSHLITVLGGPMVHVVLLAPLALAVRAVTGGWEAVVFNPFSPGAALATLSGSSEGGYALALGLWALHYANLVLLAFNMLVPMYPMDAGRVVHALLWRSMGERKATEITVIVGFVAAGVLAVVGVVFQQTLLLALAVFGGVTCYLERRKLKIEGGEPWSQAGDGWLRAGDDGEAAERAEEREAARREREALRRAQEQAEVDRILAKISASGMDSLTAKERRTLKRASGK